MPNSQNNNENNPENTKSVPFEVVDTSSQPDADSKPGKVPMEVAGLDPEPEPHEFLSAALGLKPKKKVGAKKPAVEVSAPETSTPVAEEAPGADPFASEPANVEAEEELVSVADLGEDEVDDSDPVVETTKAVEATNAVEAPQVKADVANEPVAEVAEEAKAKVKAEAKTETATEADDDEAFAAADAAAENPFLAMQLSPEVLAAIGKAGYESPSPIQVQTVPHLMDGRDLIGQAETGSGKTAAFAWPLLSRLDLSQKAPQVIVLAPTRELAVQVTTAFKKYASCTPGFRTTTIYGGQSYETQFRALDRGAHVVVGTPGRVMDHLKRGTLDLSQLKAFVLDEADEMLRMGFIDDIETILEATPRTQQSVFFSATMPRQIQRIAERYLTDPVQIRIESKTATAESIKQSCLLLSGREKLPRLVRLLETEEVDGVLVFVKTRQSTMVVAENLIQKGFIASALNGDIAQQQRERTVGQLMSGKINVVVATDVAARGLDVQRISHVINYDFPHDTESYVHRIGRTGRAGREGNAILFVEPKEKGKLSRLQRATNQRIDTFKEKSLKEINSLRVEKFKAKITEALQSDKIEFFQSMIVEMQAETELPVEQLAAALGVLAQGEKPLVLDALQSRQSNWKKDGGKRGRGEHGPMQTYRVEVGRQDNVGPGNIVGAVTNEADLSNADIGRIKIHDRYSTIDLPANLPIDVLNHLAGVFVSGRALEITKSDQPSHGYDRGGRSGGGGGRSGGGRSGGGRGDRGPRSDRGGRGREGGFNRGGNDRPPRREGGFNRGGSDRPAREGGNDRPPRREGGFNRGGSDRPAREGGNDRPPRREGGFNRGGSDRPAREGGFNRGGSDRPARREGGNDRPPRREGGFNRGGSDRPAREGGSDRPPRREGGGFSDRSPRRESTGGADRKDNRVYSTSKPGKTKAAQRAKAKRRPDAKASSPVKKYVKIRAKKK